MPRNTQPRAGEPIRLVMTKAGDARYRVKLDAAAPGEKRQQVTTTHDTLSDARAHVAAHRADRRRGTLVVPDHHTVNDLLDAWMLGARHLKASTRHGYEVHLRVVRERLGATRAQALNKRHIEDLVEHLLTTGGQRGTGRAPSTVRQSLIVLEQAIDDAQRQGLVQRNVVRLVAKPRQRRTEMRTWTAGQMAQFLDAASTDRYAALWRAAAFGLRRSEVMGLRWCDVDFDAGLLRIVQTRVSTDGRSTVVGEPKTSAGKRTIPMDLTTAAGLRRFRAQQTAEHLALGRRLPSAGLVSVDAAGRPLAPETWGLLFGRITREAGLPPIRLHDLRHTAASLLHESGTVPMRTLAAMLGHADPGFTLRTYAHASDESMIAAATTLASLLEVRSSG